MTEQDPSKTSDGTQPLDEEAKKPNADRITPVMEDYLKTIYTLQYDHDGAVWTSTVADRLEVTAPTVTSMLEKLASYGLIDREKHRPVTLTDRGEAVALSVIRRHRLLETFLVDVLEYEWDEVHPEADRLEHYVSEQFVERLTELLETPASDPHGDPIPDDGLSVPDRSWTRLSEVEDGARVEIERVRLDDEELRYLATCDVQPGAVVSVDRTPLGTLEVAVGGDSYVLPKRICDRIHVASDVQG